MPDLAEATGRQLGTSFAPEKFPEANINECHAAGLGNAGRSATTHGSHRRAAALRATDWRNAHVRQLSGHPEPTKAVRLIFEYDGDQVRLVSQQPVEVALTDADLVQPDSPGFFVDVRDNGGRTLARATARGAFAGSVEVFPEKPGEPFQRVDVARPKGAFTVVMPMPAAADRLAVVQIAPDQTGPQPPPGGGPAAAAAALKATDLASFPLSRTP